MTKYEIPWRDPEVVEAEAQRHWRGDDEKVSTTTLKELFIGETRIWSRYQQAHEMGIMRDAFLAVGDVLKVQGNEHVADIFCDSKNGGYTIKLHSPAPMMWVINFELQIMRLAGWHMGITVERLDGSRLDFLEPDSSDEIGEYWERRRPPGQRG